VDGNTEWEGGGLQSVEISLDPFLHKDSTISHPLSTWESKIAAATFSATYLQPYGNKGIIREIKSRSMRWAGHVARMGEKRNANILVLIT
jgi:hypothetical protein